MDLDSSRTHVALACQDRNIRVYDVETGKLKKTLKGSSSDEGALLKVQMDPSGSFFATSCSDKNITIFDYESGECVATLSGHSEIVTCMRFSPDCRRLISVSGDSCVFVWRLDSHMTNTMRRRRGLRVPRALETLKQPNIRRETFIMLSQMEDSRETEGGSNASRRSSTPCTECRGEYRGRAGGGGGGHLPVLTIEPPSDSSVDMSDSTTENQMYELGMATQSEKNAWKDLLDKAIVSAGGSSHINHGSHKISSPSLRSVSPISTGSEAIEDNSTAQPSDSAETQSYSDDNTSEHTPTDPSRVANYEEKQEVCVAEAALQDVETLRRLILQDLDEDGWSHNSDDTPTNEMTNGGRSLTDRERPDSLETILGVELEEEEEESNEAPPSDTKQSSFKVVRKGNMFYLVMPSGQGESFTDDLSDPPTPTASHFPPPVEEVMSLQMQPEEETCCPELNQSETMQQKEEEEEEKMCPSKSGPRNHVIKNADEIFFTIEELMRKLHKLKEIEMAHNKLLETLRDPSFSLESEDQPCHSATVSRTPSMDRSSGDSTEGNPVAPKILSTGF
uniref:Rho guanine nucleotide exchange factor (GEF) 11 n=1 Tax=Iconisemion striatum TaxID=60296 RepID=A0A1A7W723_9TELE